MADEQDPRVHINEEGGYRHVTVDGNLHSIVDEPACVYPDGTRWWYRDGKLHRIGGPAVIYALGVEEWWQDGCRHRTDGPAVTYPDIPEILPMKRGVKEYWENGVMVREEVPPKVARYRRDHESLLVKYFGA